MKEVYKARIQFKDGTSKNLRVTQEQAQKAGNINNFICSNLDGKQEIKRVLVVRKRTTKGIFAELTYDYIIEGWRKNHNRIERVNKEGYGDYSGYGCKTDGKINRFYIGKSTGWIPIYLEILTNCSTGGGSLFLKGLKSIKAIA